MIACTGMVVENRLVARDTLLVGLEAKELSGRIGPGQFVMAGPFGSGYDPFLCRPFSVHRVCGDVLYLLVAIVGRATAMLARLPERSEVQLVGPCGRGFTPPDSVSEALLVAGGIGLAPIAYLAEKLAAKAVEVTLLYGTRSSDLLVELEWLEAAGAKIFRCTDDGSAGRAGTVLDLAAEYVAALVCGGGSGRYVAACGPEPMLAALWKVFEHEQPAGMEFALENRMACGVGACLGCTIELHGGARARVCRDGPVFDARAVYGG